MELSTLKEKAKTIAVQKNGIHAILQRLIVNGFFDTTKSSDDVVTEIRNSTGTRVKSNVIQTYMKKFMENEIIRSIKKPQGNGNLWLLAGTAETAKTSECLPFTGIKTKILFLAANPSGTHQLALDNECREIEEKIRASKHRDSLELVTKWAVRPLDLLQHFNDHSAHVIHFSGHGSVSEEIIFSDSNGKPQAVGQAALKQLFKTLKDKIRLVILNACYSRAQAEAITEVVDCAVGMNKAIGDRAAIVFAAAFYQAIGFGRSIGDAFESGKTAIMLEGIPEDQTPELIFRKGIDPATIFLLEQEGPQNSKK